MQNNNMNNNIRENDARATLPSTLLLFYFKCEEKLGIFFPFIFILEERVITHSRNDIT